MSADPLVDVLRKADGLCIVDGQIVESAYVMMARAAREHIAAEIEAANKCYDESLDYAALIARGES